MPRGPASQPPAACVISFDTLAATSETGGRLLRSSWTTEHFWLDCGHATCQPCLVQYAATSVSKGKTADRPLKCPM